MSSPLKGLPPNLPPPPPPIQDAKPLDAEAKKAQNEKMLANLPPPPPPIAKTVTQASGDIIKTTGAVLADNAQSGTPVGEKRTVSEIDGQKGKEVRFGGKRQKIDFSKLPAPPSRPDASSQNVVIPKRPDRPPPPRPNAPPPPNSGAGPAPAPDPKLSRSISEQQPPARPPLQHAYTQPAKLGPQMSPVEFLKSVDARERSNTIAPNKTAEPPDSNEAKMQKENFQKLKTTFENSELQYLEKADHGLDRGLELLNSLFNNGIISRDDLAALTKDYLQTKAVVDKDRQNIKNNNYENGAEIYKNHSEYKKDTADSSKLVDNTLRRLNNLESQKTDLEGALANATAKKTEVLKEQRELTKSSSDTNDYKKWANKTKFGTEYPEGYVKSSKEIKFEQNVRKLEEVDKELRSIRNDFMKNRLDAEKMSNKKELLGAYLDARKSVQGRLENLTRNLNSLAIHPGSTKETRAPYETASVELMKPVKEKERQVERSNYIKLRDELISSGKSALNAFSALSEANIDRIADHLRPEDVEVLKAYARNGKAVLEAFKELETKLESRLANASIEEIPQILNEVLELDNTTPTLRPLRNIMLHVSALAKDQQKIADILNPLNRKLTAESYTNPELKSLADLSDQLAKGYNTPVQRMSKYPLMMRDFFKSNSNSGENKKIMENVLNHTTETVEEMNDLLKVYEKLEIKEQLKKSVSSVEKITTFIRRLTPFTSEMQAPQEKG